MSEDCDNCFERKRLSEVQRENKALKKRAEAAESDWQLAEVENKQLRKLLKEIKKEPLAAMKISQVLKA